MTYTVHTIYTAQVRVSDGTYPITVEYLDKIRVRVGAPVDSEVTRTKFGIDEIILFKWTRKHDYE